MFAVMKASFDMVDSERMNDVLEERGLPKRSTRMRQGNRVCGSDKLREVVRLWTKRSLRQLCPLGHMLFSSTFQTEECMREG